MRHVTLGRRCGLRVSELALGTGTFGTRWGYGADAAEAASIFDGFAEAGGTFLDTADSYQAGESEELLADLIAAERDHFVVGTKYATGGAGAPHVLTTGTSRRTMTIAVEASLRRLRTDRIDLLWVHFDDLVTPVDEIARGLDDLVTSGKVLYAGLSNFPAWRSAQAVTVAELRGWSPVVAVQVEYSLVERGAEAEVLPMAESLGLGVTAWSPLGGGLLTGKYRSGDAGRMADLGVLVHAEDTQRKTATVDAVLEVAAAVDASPAQVAMAWLRSRHERSATSVVSIVGPRTRTQMDDYLVARSITLTDAQLDALSDASRRPAGAPHNAIAGARGLLAGGDPDLLVPAAG